MTETYNKYANKISFIESDRIWMKKQDVTLIFFEL